MNNSEVDRVFFALLLWREARGEDFQTKRAVACSIRNRVEHPSWWGQGWCGIMFKKWQYSSMTAPNDPNLVKFPQANDTSWIASMDVADEVYNGPMVDSANGATHYFDKSLDENPPAWIKAANMEFIMDSGNFHFYRENH